MAIDGGIGDVSNVTMSLSNVNAIGNAAGEGAYHVVVVTCYEPCIRIL
jgi:hypothetical protein